MRSEDFHTSECLNRKWINVEPVCDLIGSAFWNTLTPAEIILGMPSVLWKNNQIADVLTSIEGDQVLTLAPALLEPVLLSVISELLKITVCPTGSEPLTPYIFTNRFLFCSAPGSELLTYTFSLTGCYAGQGHNFWLPFSGTLILFFFLSFFPLLFSLFFSLELPIHKFVPSPPKYIVIS